MTTKTTTPVTTDRLLRVEAVAELLDTSKSSVYRLVYENQLATVKIGLGKSRPRIRIRESVVRAFIASGVTA